MRSWLGFEAGVHEVIVDITRSIEKYSQAVMLRLAHERMLNGFKVVWYHQHLLITRQS